MYDFIVIGAAQSGLAISYYLKKLNKKFILVDKGPEVGYSWLRRWDSLRLFTPSEFNNLPGMDFPQPKGYYPNKQEVAQYFKSYADQFDFSIRLNCLITRVTPAEYGYALHWDGGCLKTRGLIVATGPFHIPYIPPFAENLSKAIFQSHSNAYKNAQQLKEGPVLVVGDGDSGYQILDEISKTGRKTYFSGHSDVRNLPQEFAGKTLWWWFSIMGFLKFNRYSRIGKWLKNRKQPIIGTDTKRILNRSNVIVVGRATGAGGKCLVTEKENLTNLKNVIWATGYKPNFKWIEDLAIDKEGYPIQKRGITDLKNLYCIGLPWLYTRGSATLGGVGNDAAYIARHIENHF